MTTEGMANRIRIMAFMCESKDVMSCEFGNEFATKVEKYLLECLGEEEPHVHDYANAVRKGRAHYVCPACGDDISLEVVLMAECGVNEPGEEEERTSEQTYV